MRPLKLLYERLEGKEFCKQLAALLEGSDLLTVLVKGELYIFEDR